MAQIQDTTKNGRIHCKYLEAMPPTAVVIPAVQGIASSLSLRRWPNVLTSGWKAEPRPANLQALPSLYSIQWLGREVKDNLVPTPCHGHLLLDLLAQSLIHSWSVQDQGGTSTASLSSLFPCNSALLPSQKTISF